MIFTFHYQLGDKNWEFLIASNISTSFHRNLKTTASILIELNIELENLNYPSVHISNHSLNSDFISNH